MKRKAPKWVRVGVFVIIISLSLQGASYLAYSFSQEPELSPTPTPWPTVEVPGATHIDAAVSKFGMGIGTSLYIIEGETVTGRPFICAIYVQYDTDPIHCDFGDYSLEWTPDIPQ